MRQRIATRGFRGESGNRRISIASRGYHPLGDVLDNVCRIPVYEIQIQTYGNTWEVPDVSITAFLPTTNIPIFAQVGVWERTEHRSSFIPNTEIPIAPRAPELGYTELRNVSLPGYSIEIITYSNEWEKTNVGVWKEQINFNMYISKGFCYNIRR